MKKAMLVGKIGCGKTTLTQVLKEEAVSYCKTQTIEYHENIIDTPGEYLEMRNYYQALTITAYDVDLVFLMQSCVDDTSSFAPAFSNMFTKPVYGIVTKIDCKDANIPRAKEFLLAAGATEVFEFSAFMESDLETIKNIVFS